VGECLRIGVDFDNTLVRCDEVFHRAAVEQGLIPPALPVSKAAVRHFLRAAGNEEAWTRLQGYVYGVGIRGAPAFPGSMDFFRAAARRAVPVFVVSHRTRRPYLGPPYDLHRAALAWMEKNGLFETRCGLSRDRVFFETSLPEKLARIGALTCTHFLDDLPELLSEPAFPRGVQPRLFDPDDEHTACGALARVRSWREFESEVLPA
jgi:hypothetical protein